MSHIAKFNLKVDNESRLRNALGNISSQVTDGYFITNWASMNRRSGTVINGNKVTQWNGQRVALGAKIGRSSSGNHIGFAEQNDGSLQLVGDTYGTGMSNSQIENIIDNAYVNEAVEEVVPDLFALGFVEETDPLQLEMLTY